jgi:hypothetical protein
MKLKSTFKSKWFNGLVTIVAINEEINEMLVDINPQEENRSTWRESWNLAHTRTGFNNGDYYDLTI